MKIKNYRWIIVSMLFFATTINYMDRQIIGLLKPTLESEFNWTETDFAHIVMAFTAAYAIGLLLLGRFIDWVGTKTGYSVAVVVWSLAGMLHAVAKSVWGFSFARIGLGIGEAGNFPAAMKAVSEWFPKKERALATGIFNAGTSVGVVLALVLCPYILSAYGWREVFWVTGALGFVWLALWLFLYDVPSRQKRLSREELELINKGQEYDSDRKEKEISVKWIKLFSFPQTWAVVIGKFMIDPIYWFFLFWLPSYFTAHFQIDLTKPSIPLMIIYAATTIGCVGGGYLSSWFIRRGMATLKARRKALLIFAVTELCVIMLQFVSNVWIAVAILSLAVAVHQGWATNVFTLASDMFPKQVVSSVVGIAGMSGAVGGILFPMFVGFLLDYYKNLGNISFGYNIIFTFCGCTYLVVWLIITFLIKRSEKIKIETAIFK
ncbi:MAG: MFS transporter [Prolixibacteraceae bacterium]|jgi:ACS family hexuronate transporter-like MFS transporter|nr:MFS transporter [Prolixibacteraceae bacterium]